MQTQLPKDVLLPALRKPATELTAVERMSNPTLITMLRDGICEAQLRPSLRDELRDLLGDSLCEMKLEDVSRNHPGMIGTLYPETA
jgi:hypothetical protein